MNIDKHTPTWQAVEARLLERRAECVQSLINGTQADDKLRGKIQLIDDFLAEAREEARQEPLPDTDY